MYLKILISLIISSACVFGAEHGLMLGFSKNYQFHNSEISEYSQNYTCCGNFSDGNSDGISINFTYGISIFDKLDIGFNTSYYQFSGRFKNSYDEILNFNGNTYDGSFDYLLDLEASGYNFLLNIQYEALNNFYINLGGGINYLQNMRLDGSERLSSPSDIGFFLDQSGNDTTRIRNEFSDEISGGINPLINLNFSYALPLNEDFSFELRPNFGLQYNLNGFSGNENWSYFDFNFGLGAVYYINRKDPEVYFPKDEVIDSLLFVTCVPLADETLPFSDYVITERISVNSVYSLPGVDIPSNNSESSEFIANYPGLSFIYDYSHLNYKGTAFIDIRLGFIEVSIPALGKNKNKINFKIEPMNLGGVSDTISYRLRVIGSENVRVGAWIKKPVTKKKDYDIELTYFIGDNEVSPLQLEGLEKIQNGTVEIFSDDEELIELFRSYFETVGIKVESEKVREMIPGTRSLIIRQKTNP